VGLAASVCVGGRRGRTCRLKAGPVSPGQPSRAPAAFRLMKFVQVRHCADDHACANVSMNLPDNRQSAAPPRLNCGQTRRIVTRLLAHGDDPLEPPHTAAEARPQKGKA
jgi:hypothetical protein